MRAIKGCVNKKCIAFEKGIIYKESDEFCSKCGEKLRYVCKRCHKQLPDDSQKYCEVCIAERDDKKNNNADNGKKAVRVGVAIVGLVGSAIPIVKQFIKK